MGNAQGKHGNRKLRHYSARFYNGSFVTNWTCLITQSCSAVFKQHAVTQQHSNPAHCRIEIQHILDLFLETLRAMVKGSAVEVCVKVLTKALQTQPGLSCIAPPWPPTPSVSRETRLPFGFQMIVCSVHQWGLKHKYMPHPVLLTLLLLPLYLLK